MRPGTCRDARFPFDPRHDAGFFVGIRADVLANYRGVSLPEVTCLLRMATPQHYYVGCTRAKSKSIHSTGLIRGFCAEISCSMIALIGWTTRGCSLHPDNASASIADQPYIKRHLSSHCSGSVMSWPEISSVMSTGSSDTSWWWPVANLSFFQEPGRSVEVLP